MKVPVVSSVSRKRGFSIVGLVVRVMPIFIATAAIAFGCFSTAALRAQDSPTVGVSRLNGDWQNVDPNTRGIVEIVVKGMKIHPYGKCHPTACDWGTIKAKGFASSVDAQDVSRLVAKKHNSFDQVEITLSLEADGRLRVESFTHFTDGSGRADYSAVGYFQRGRRPYTP